MLVSEAIFGGLLEQKITFSPPLSFGLYFLQDHGWWLLNADQELASFLM